MEERVKVSAHDGVRRDVEGRVVWVIMEFWRGNQKLYTATFMQNNKRVQRIKHSDAPYIPPKIFKRMAKIAAGIIFDKRRKKPEQLNFPF